MPKAGLNETEGRYTEWNEVGTTQAPRRHSFHMVYQAYCINFCHIVSFNLIISWHIVNFFVFVVGKGPHFPTKKDAPIFELVRFEPYEGKLSSTVCFGGRSPTGSPHFFTWLAKVVGLPIPTRGMLGFAKSSTLRCLSPIGFWRTSRYQRRSLWSLLYPYRRDATKCSDHCAMS